MINDDENEGRAFSELSDEERVSIIESVKSSGDWDYMKKWFLCHFEPSQFSSEDMVRAQPGVEISYRGEAYKHQRLDGRIVFEHPKNILALHFQYLHPNKIFELVGDEIQYESQSDGFKIGESKLGDPNSKLIGPIVTKWQSKKPIYYDSKAALKKWFFDHFEDPSVPEFQTGSLGYDRKDSKPFERPRWHEKDGKKIPLYEPFECMYHFIKDLHDEYDDHFLEDLADEIITETGITYWQIKSWSEVNNENVPNVRQEKKQLTDAIVEVKRTINKLESYIESIEEGERPIGIGHNNPPEGIDDIYNEESIIIQEGIILPSSLNEIKAELDKPKPSIETLGTNHVRLALLRKVLTDVYEDARKYGIKYFMKYSFKELYDPDSIILNLKSHKILYGLLILNLAPILNALANLIHVIAGFF